jgi:hypothetical protein
MNICIKDEYVVVSSPIDVTHIGEGATSHSTDHLSEMNSELLYWNSFTNLSFLSSVLSLFTRQY